MGVDTTYARIDSRSWLTARYASLETIAGLVLNKLTSNHLKELPDTIASVMPMYNYVDTAIAYVPIKDLRFTSLTPHYQ